MKLLVLTQNLPSPTWGGGTRNYHFLKALAARHTVSLLCLVHQEELESTSLELLERFLYRIRVVFRGPSTNKRLLQLMYLARGRSYSLGNNASTHMQEAVDTFLTEESYDAVLFENVLMADYRLPEGMKCIIDQHNIEYELLWRTFQHESAGWRKWYSWWESRVLKPLEIELCRKADLVLTTSERDRCSLKRLLPSTLLHVVPNGVDIEKFQNCAEDRASCQIIFTGAMNYYPNIAAVLLFAKQCWPRIRAKVPGATWIIVGLEPPASVRKLAELPGIIVTGSVPDVRPYFADSAVAIVPLQVGSGTRLKILEAFAMRKAVVSSSLGCEGLSVVPEEHLLIADRPAEFAQAVITLLNNPERRKTLGDAGRALVETEYSWEYCGSELLQALETSIQEGVQIC